MGTNRGTLRITPELLREHNACDSKILLFKSWLEKRGWKSARVTASNLRSAENFGLQTIWLWRKGIVPSEGKWRDLYILQGPKHAYHYARLVDRDPRDDTRGIACGNAWFSDRYAQFVDECPRDDTREGACANPEWAVSYAEYVDKCPRDDTRRAACKSPRHAYMYAFVVDKCPRDDTRAAACGDPEHAYMYALVVDKCPRDDTRAAAEKNQYYGEWYRTYVGTFPDYE